MYLTHRSAVALIQPLLASGTAQNLPLSALCLQEIDGKALLLLRSDMMMKYMGLKLGPALKLTYHIDKLKQGKF